MASRALSERSLKGEQRKERDANPRNKSTKKELKGNVKKVEGTGRLRGYLCLLFMLILTAHAIHVQIHPTSYIEHCLLFNAQTYMYLCICGTSGHCIHLHRLNFF